MPAFNPPFKDNIDSFSYGASKGFDWSYGAFFIFGEYDTGTSSDFNTTVRPNFTDGINSPYAGQCKTIQNLIDDGVITNSTSSTARNYVCYTIISEYGVGGASPPYVEFGVGFIRRISTFSSYPHALIRTDFDGQGYLIYQKNAGTEAGSFPRLQGTSSTPSYNVFFGFPQTRAVYSANHHAAPRMEDIAMETSLALDLFTR